MQWVVLFLITLNVSYSECILLPGLNIYPLSGENVGIGNKNIYVIETNHYYKYLAITLNTINNIYLESDKHKVKLNIIDTCENISFDKQIVLQQSETLNTGDIYRLKIDSIRKFYEYLLNQQDLKDLKYEEFIIDFNETFKNTYFKVNNYKDTNNPILIQKPIVLTKYYAQKGCGDDNYLDFSFNIIDSSKVIVETIVKSKSSNIVRKYYLFPKNNELRVGREMCGGPFEFDDGGDEYEIKFNLIDVCGNRTDWVGEPISFTRPIKEYIKTKSKK